MTTREEILNKSLSLFADQGYENTGVQRIVDESGVTKPTLYHYFGSKKGLLEHLLIDNFKPFLNELEKRAIYNGDIVFTLEEIVSHFFSFAQKQQNFYRFTLGLSFSSPDSEARLTVQPFIEKQFFMLQSVFEKAEHDHGNMKGKSSRFALSLMGTINAYISVASYTELILKQEDSHQACLQFMYGIFS